MLQQYYKKILAGCALLLVAGACDNVPDDIAETHRQASAAEHTAVQALNRLDDDTTRAELSDIREQYASAAMAAIELRESMRAQLQSAIEGRFLSSEKLPQALQLNDDLLRCHETLQQRAGNAFEFVSTGRARRASLKDVWGIVDPRGCFDELAPAWDQLLQ